MLFFFPRGVLDEILNLIDSVSEGFPSYFSIQSFVFKSAADELAPILTRIYQTSFDTGQVPSDWRDAWIVPVFKKEDKHKAASYRPVSVTSITCMLLEHIVHSRQISIICAIGWSIIRGHCQALLSVDLDGTAYKFNFISRVDITRQKPSLSCQENSAVGG